MQDFSSASKGLLGLDTPKVEAVGVKAPKKKTTPAPSQALRQDNPQKENAPTNDIFSEISAPARRGRDTTVYLSNDVLDAVKKVSEHWGISKSKVIDTALRQVLIKNREV